MSSVNRTVEKKTAVKNSIGRGSFAALSILLEMASIILTVTFVNNYAEWIALGTRLLSFVLVLYIYSQYKTASLKMPWIVLILAVPIVGVTMFLLVGLNKGPKKMRKRYEDIDKTLFAYIPQDPIARTAEAADNQRLCGVSDYLRTNAGYPVYQNSDIRFYADQCDALDALVDGLNEAEKFIFMEYHAIENTAECWGRIEEVLIRKAAAGVEVRLFYDDIGSIFFLNREFVHRMESFGIQCRVFNPLVPFLNFFLNNRDHRKITIVDGKTAFTGGYNLANEYFNVTHPYGKWKDTGVKITGRAVRSFTVMFLEMWNAIRKNDKDDVSFDRYLAVPDYTAEEDGFIQPYSDNPMDNEQVGENVYIELINQACDYIYFTTPYLILTDEMIHALGLAAKRGVDVRILTPGIPDKKMVYNVTRSYYHGLVRNGVRIYEYVPGFLHSKQCVSDDKVAVCGTINLDYRSFYHHFENAVLFSHCSAVTDVKKDILQILPSCRDVTEQYKTGRSRMMRFSQLCLRIVAPLM